MARWQLDGASGSCVCMGAMQRQRRKRADVLPNGCFYSGRVRSTDCLSSGTVLPHLSPCGTDTPTVWMHWAADAG